MKSDRNSLIIIWSVQPAFSLLSYSGLFLLSERASEPLSRHASHQTPRRMGRPQRTPKPSQRQQAADAAKEEAANTPARKPKRAAHNLDPSVEVQQDAAVAVAIVPADATSNADGSVGEHITEAAESQLVAQVGGFAANEAAAATVSAVSYSLGQDEVVPVDSESQQSDALDALMEETRRRLDKQRLDDLRTQVAAEMELGGSNGWRQCFASRRDACSCLQCSDAGPPLLSSLHGRRCVFSDGNEQH